MVLLADAKTGLESWIEKSIIQKIPGEGKRAVVAVLARRILNNIDKLSDVNNPLLTMTNLIVDGKLDEEAIIELRQALGTKGKFELNLPMIGSFAIDGDALDDLYSSLTTFR
jgi:hypothetical protein